MVKSKSIVFVTGGGGYLGSVMIPLLLAHGHKVRVLDRFFWGKEVFAHYVSNDNLSLIEGDTRSLPKSYLKNIDVVIDLAALSNDPIGELNPQRTLDINYYARVRTASLAKQMGVRKYILASSCSVYGYRDGILEETSVTAPVTTYARASLLAEKGVLSLATKQFSVTVLRQGTLYGLSPRMRFDLVLNAMVLSYFRNNLITVQGGEQWRPLVHVSDSAAAFINFAEAKSSKENGEIFNVGSTKQNFKIKDLAERIARALNPSPKIIVQDVQADFRSYRVSFEKINNKIDWRTKKTPDAGVKEIHFALKKGHISDTPQTKTIDWYKYLLSVDPTVLDAKKCSALGLSLKI